MATGGDSGHGGGLDGLGRAAGRRSYERPIRERAPVKTMPSRPAFFNTGPHFRSRDAGPACSGPARPGGE
jgi:hypothetical protein